MGLPAGTPDSSSEACGMPKLALHATGSGVLLAAYPDGIVARASMQLAVSIAIRH